MTSNYLKALQLSKQLEEKAKEATRVHKDAEDALKDIDKVIEEAKRIDANTAKAEALVQEARDAMEKKDYKEALDKATAARENLENAKKDRIESAFKAAEELVDLGDNLEQDMSKARGFLDEAKTLAEEGNFEEATSLAQKSWEESQKTLHEQVSEAFSTSQSILLMAKDAGEDVSSLEEYVEAAKKAIDDVDYREALKNIGTVLEKSSARLKDFLTEKIDDAQADIDMAEDLDIPVTKSEKLLDEAREHLEKGEFQKAMKTIDKSKDMISTELEGNVREAIDDIREQLREAKEIEADVGNAKELYKDAKKEFRNKNYKNAMDAISEAREELSNAQFQRVLKTISQSRSKFIAAKKIGADITNAVNLLNKARDALKGNDYNAALEYAQKSDEEIDKVVSSYQTAKEEIENVENIFSKAQEMGIDTSRSKELVERARSALDNMDFEKSLDLIKKSREETERAEYERVMEVIEATETALTLCEKVEIDTEDLSQLLEESIQHLKNKKFTEAMKIATQGKEEAEKLMEIKIKKLIEESEILLSMESVLDTTRAKECVASAREDLAKKSFQHAYEMAMECQRSLTEGKEETLKKLIGDTESAIREAKELDVDVFAASELLEKAKEAKSAGELEKVMELTKTCNEEIKNGMKSAVNEAFNSAKKSAIEAQKLGINITSLKELLKGAKSAFETRDFKRTLQLSKQADLEAEASKKKYQAAYNAMSESAALLAEAKKHRIDVASVADDLIKAKKSFEEQQFDQSVQISKDANNKIEKLMSQYVSAKTIISAQQMIKIAQKLEIDVNEPLNLLGDAKTAMKSKEYDLSLEKAREAETTANSLIVNAMQETILVLEGDIKSARTIGVNAKVAEQHLGMAKGALEEKNYEVASTEMAASRQELDTIREKAQKVAENIQRANNVISDGRNIGADVAQAKELAQKAVAALKNNDYDSANQYVESAIAMAEAAQVARVNQVIEFFETAAGKVKTQNVDTSKAEILISRAKKKLEDKEYKEALNLAMQSESELEQADLQHKMAAESIATTEARLNELQHEGINSGNMESMLVQAKTLFESGDYVKSLELAIEVGEKIHALKEAFKDADKYIQEARHKITEYYKQGIDITKAKATFTQAKTSLESNDFQGAVTKAKQSIKEADQAKLSVFQAKQGEVSNLISMARGMGVDVSGAEAKYSSSEKALQSGDEDAFHKVLMEARTIIEYEMERKVNDAFASVEGKLGQAKSAGTDTSESEGFLAKAKAAHKEKDFKAVFDLIAEAEGALSGTRGLLKNVLDMTYEADSIISSAKKYGIDVKQAEKFLAQAYEVKESDPPKALELATQSRDNAQKVLDNLSPKLEIVLKPEDMKEGEFGKLSVEVSNTGRGLAKGLDFEFESSGEFDIEDVPEIRALRGGGKEAFDLKIKPNTGGQPLDITIKLTTQRVFDGKEYPFEASCHINVEAPKKEEPAAKTFQKTIAQAESKCMFCKGKIKSGMAIIQCNCGNAFHEPCANRVATCPKCGNSVKHAASKKKLALKIG